MSPDVNKAAGVVYAVAASYAAALKEVKHRESETLTSDMPGTSSVAVALCPQDSEYVCPSSWICARS